MFFILLHIKEGATKPERRHPDAISRFLSLGSGLRAIALNPFSKNTVSTNGTI
ncbi:MAG: hypothetical protein ABSC53_10890 [Bacteroidota bacterium]